MTAQKNRFTAMTKKSIHRTNSAKAGPSTEQARLPLVVRLDYSIEYAFQSHGSFLNFLNLLYPLRGSSHD